MSKIISEFYRSGEGNMSNAEVIRSSEDSKVPLIDVEYTEEDLKFDLADLYSPSSPYSPEQKISAVMAYLVTGASTRAQHHCGVKADIIRDWKSKSSWWHDVMAECRKQKNDEIDAKFTEIMHDTLGELHERIHNGDEVLAKDGSLIRKKINGKDLAVIAAVMYDKRALLRGDPTSRIERKGNNDQMTLLQKNFEKIAHQLEAKTVNGKSTIIEDDE